MARILEVKRICGPAAQWSAILGSALGARRSAARRRRLARWLKISRTLPRPADLDSPDAHAIRANIRGRVQAVGFRQAVRSRALELGVFGWVRNGEDGSVAVRAEGPPAALDAFVSFLRDGPPSAAVADLALENVRVEGHEQFAVRGVPAGAFVVQEHAATAHHFDLRLEVDGVMRSWALPKGPSLDPATKRLAVQVEDHQIEHNSFEGPTSGGGGVVVWDRGDYEQGGRVAWPQALERGHAVFVLHGHKLRGGFALQRTRPVAKPQWLLIKRRDDEARPGSDVVAEQPASVLSGQTLEELRGDGG
jgi:DNA ligase D-like protein (predicted 3'-phosphoesterase)